METQETASSDDGKIPFRTQFWETQRERERERERERDVRTHVRDSPRKQGTICVQHMTISPSYQTNMSSCAIMRQSCVADWQRKEMC